jgi:hypothetical protein
MSHQQFCWLGKIIYEESFTRCERSFILMTLGWHNYLVLSLGNYAMKLCIETGLILISVSIWIFACFLGLETHRCIFVQVLEIRGFKENVFFLNFLWDTPFFHKLSISTCLGRNTGKKGKRLWCLPINHQDYIDAIYT